MGQPVKEGGFLANILILRVFLELFLWFWLLLG